MTLPPLITVLCSPSLGHLRPSIGAFFTLTSLLINQKCGRSCSCACPEGAGRGTDAWWVKSRRLVTKVPPSGGWKRSGTVKVLPSNLSSDWDLHTRKTLEIEDLDLSFLLFLLEDCSPFYRFSHHQVEFEPRTGELHVVVYRLFSRQNCSLNIF